MRTGAGKRITVVGLGNIGGSLVQHLARMTELSHLTLIDPDAYERSNLLAQCIERRDVGRPKVEAQRERLRRIRRDLRIEAVAARVETLPPGTLRGDLILGCVDSRATRQHLNEVAWHLDLPYFDAGVQGPLGLARVTTFLPGPGGACLECGWGDADYDLLQREQSYPCRPRSGRAAVPTGASFGLGALAAALLARACEDRLGGGRRDWVSGRQIVLDARGHRSLVTDLRRDPRCRLDHAIWTVEPVERSPGEMTLAEALRLGGSRGDALRVEGSAFATRLTCRGCGETEPLLHLLRSLPRETLRCARCGGRRYATGMDRLDRLEPARLSASRLALTLGSLGAMPGDIVGIDSGQTRRHFELCGALAARATASG